jgi:predicted nucleic acid-binding protein
VRAIFLDAVGLLAFWNADDQWHRKASEAFRLILANRWRIITTTFVMLECGNAASRSVIKPGVCDFRRGLELANSLVSPTELDWIQAWASYERGEAGNAGIVDQVSFAVMRRFGLTKAFTNDRHFKAAGFENLF